jgi:Cu2+-containing amine oxidase
MDPLRCGGAEVRVDNLACHFSENTDFTAYQSLVPSRSGTARHTELFTRNDFWVTRYNGSELLAVNLPTYIANGESTANTDVVVWYTGSFHHEANEPDEDANTVGVHWTGFELKPKNLFDGTPFYPN